MDFTPYIGPIVTALVAAGGTYAAMSSRIARLEAMIEALASSVERHNEVIERTYKLESDMSTAYMRIDELKAADLRLEAKIDDMRR